MNPILLPTFSSTSRPVRLFSYGGGVQSNAVLALQASGEVYYDVFVFSNVGDDSENPDTLAYIEEYAKPFAERHGIPFFEVQKTRRDGRKDTLVDWIYRTERSVPIPARMSNGAPGNRSCTNTMKIAVVDKWIKNNGYTHATVGLGISLDELSRMRPAKEQWHVVGGQRASELPHLAGIKYSGFWKRLEYPLIDLRISREGCHRIILNAGLPIAPKSSCFFCPFKKRSEWKDMKRRRPDLFEKSVDIDRHINKKREAIGKDRVYLHADCIPLDRAVGPQMTLFTDDEMDVCESGYCFT